jgi:hypothetical protein
MKVSNHHISWISCKMYESGIFRIFPALYSGGWALSWGAVGRSSLHQGYVRLGERADVLMLML